MQERPEPSDDHLVCAAVSGDVDALSLLLERVGEGLAARIRGRIDPQWASALDADDVLQVTYLEAFLQIETLATHNLRGFQAWLARMAENNLRDAIRGLVCEKRPQPSRRVGMPGEESNARLLELSGAASRTTSRKCAHAEAARLLEIALTRLPPDYAVAIRLFDLDGCSAAQVAEQMGRSRGAVHMIRARALRRLRSLLGEPARFFTDSA